MLSQFIRGPEGRENHPRHAPAGYPVKGTVRANFGYMCMYVHCMVRVPRLARYLIHMTCTYVHASVRSDACTDVGLEI